MTVIAILAGLIVGVGALVWLFDRRRGGAEPPRPEAAVEPQECCGMHITCERDSLLASVSDEIIYYDDEELDRFAGRSEDAYDDAETEEFRDVLLTLRPEEIAGWGRSVQLRGIALPSAVRDELLMIVREQREMNGKNA